MSSTAIPKVVPAQLSFLAIYNPSLSSSDEDVHKQIVFYHSKASKTKPKAQGKRAKSQNDTQAHNQEKDEQLLQVGLAQGMVGFAKSVLHLLPEAHVTEYLTLRRSFSNGEPVESIDTDKCRIVLTELEDSFWILAVCKIVIVRILRPELTTI